jgi:hypothetical protein
MTAVTDEDILLTAAHAKPRSSRRRPRNLTAITDDEGYRAPVRQRAQRFLTRYWSVVLLAATVLSGAVLAPSRDAAFEVVELSRTVEFLASPFLFACMALLVVGMEWQKRNARDATDAEFGVALWHLTNACWWSFGCDTLSGLLAVMPLLRSHYDALDRKHTMGADARACLDSVYLAEATVHVPLSWLVFYALVKKRPYARTAEAFLCGCQLVGTICYYAPEGFSDTKTWPRGGLALYAGVYFGATWIVVPLLLLRRSCRLDSLEAGRRGAR